MRSKPTPAEELLIAIGSQGTAGLAIFMKLFRALAAKGVLRDIEIAAILDSAAESAEKSPDELGGKYSKSVGQHIRDIMDQYPKPDAKTH